MPKVIHRLGAGREGRPKPTGPREGLRGEGWSWKVLQSPALWKETERSWIQIPMLLLLVVCEQVTDLSEPGPQFPHLYNETDKYGTGHVVLSTVSGPQKGLKKW